MKLKEIDNENLTDKNWTIMQFYW